MTTEGIIQKVFNVYLSQCPCDRDLGSFQLVTQIQQELIAEIKKVLSSNNYDEHGIWTTECDKEYVKSLLIGSEADTQ